MSFAVTSARFYQGKTFSANPTNGTQIIELNITKSAAGDVAVDLFAAAGTFWTSAIADAAFGAYAVKVLAALKPIMTTGIANLVSCEITAANGFLFRVNAAPTGATEYRLTTSGTYPAVVPVITLNNSLAPASFCVLIQLQLNDNVPTVEFV